MSNSLEETFEERKGELHNSKKQQNGLYLLVVGLSLVLIGSIFASTGIGNLFGMNTWQSWELGGIAAGLGVPIIFTGVTYVIPNDSSKFERQIGPIFYALGVGLFYYAFPNMWYGDATDLSFIVVSVYFVGTLITFTVMFKSLVQFKRRNDPGGTVEINVNKESNSNKKKTRINKSSIGYFGNQPSGEVETQTNNTEKSETTTVRQ